MQGAVDGAHMHHPDFRANGRIFATLHGDDASGTVMLTPEEQQEFLTLKPKMFKRPLAPGAVRAALTCASTRRTRARCARL